MPRGRKPTKPAEPQGPEFVLKTPPEMAAAVVRMADTQAAMEDALGLGQSMGVMALGLYMRNIAGSAVLSAFEHAKKSKAWKNLKSCDGRNFESLEEFCEEQLGHSYRRLAELSANKKALGAEAFEQAGRLGLRQIDYNAIKALPAPDQELIRQAVEEASSRDDVLNLLQELAARHANENDEKNKRIADLEADAAAKDKRLGVERQRIDELESRLERRDRQPPDDTLRELRKGMAARACALELFIAGDLMPAIQAVLSHHGQHGGDSDDVIEGVLRQIERAIASSRVEIGMPGGLAGSWYDGSAIDTDETVAH